MKLINIIAILFLFCSCKTYNTNRNIIAFSCIKCSGCVTNNLNYIKDHGLDKRFKIIIDTSCYESQMYILHNINFQQMTNSEIEKRFGRFGNFILIDSNGKKTEFLTDMNLTDFVQ
jgi:hypothetical protein